MNIVYVDELNLFSLLGLLRVRPTTVFYLSITRVMERILPWVELLGLKRWDVRAWTFHLGEIHAERGDGRYKKIMFDDVTRLCARIESEKFKQSPVVALFSGHFGEAETGLFLKKNIHRTIQKYVAIIDAIACRRQNAEPTAGQSVTFLFSHYFADILGDYALQRGLRSKSYGHPVRWVRRTIRSCIRLIWPVLAIRGLIQKSAAAIPDRSMIACVHMGRGLSLNPALRSDLFWLIPPNIPKSSVVVCFTRTDIPATADMIDSLISNGIGYIALNPEATQDPRVPIHRPGWISLGVCIYWNFRVIGAVIHSIIRQRKIFTFYVDLLLSMIRHYARWVDFIRRSGIRMIVQNNDFADDAVPLYLALRDCDGISVGYQFAELQGPNIPASPCRDVYFAFGPDSHGDLIQGHSIVHSLIDTGFVTDVTFDAVRENAAGLRKRILSAGASVIVCLFDENSTSHGIAFVSHRQTAVLYRLFLERVLSDQSFGLIIKPKHPRTLFRRVPDVKPMLEKAVATGRCVYMEKGKHLTDIMPAEAAQAADVAVGFLKSGTAALEAHLAGTPALFLEMGRRHEHPGSNWPRWIVFEPWDQIWAEIFDYCSRPSRLAAFNDLSRGIEKKDPFRDGMATTRMNQYIAWLLNGLTAGEGREDARAAADRNYRRLWTDRRIINR